MEKNLKLGVQGKWVDFVEWPLKLKNKIKMQRETGEVTVAWEWKKGRRGGQQDGEKEKPKQKELSMRA